MLAKSLLLTGALVLLPTSAFAADAVENSWPQWRGPARDGTVAGPAWPEKISGGRLTRTWRAELGPSYSGPIVVGDRVYTTETRNAKTEHVQALDRATGQKLWEVSWTGALSVPFFAKSNGDWIRSTPACDGESLYVGGMRDLLVCLDAATGSERWRLDFAEVFKSPLPAFGFVCSPLVVDDVLYVQAGGGFVKLDKRTGKVLWRTLDDGGGMNGSAFSSPILTTLNGQPQLLVQTREKLAGVEPESGKVLWSTPVEAFRGMNIVTPTRYENQLFTSSYGGGSFLFAVDPTDAAVSQVWKNKVQGYMSTPVIIGGHAYLHLRNQRFACIDLATGKEAWVSTPFGKYWSLVVQGDRILALDETGDLRLIRATPEKFDLLDEVHLTDDSTWAHLAVAGHELFIRDLKGLTACQWK
ncbi:PQQ-binding-like beta-propeller repeat protein [Planctellipticum variicoloris]|uniref:PQQ-binding-like beta-propeller repeat protein n=1 Tax=Planctellipticum variicoloris TaxID=3064265 RepID=UPI003013A240|nr:PQQ-like beta-propeller repeat protein [Planctomycetaceae bacterium SH412]